jgi:hypothetical protein
VVGSEAVGPSVGASVSSKVVSSGGWLRGGWLFRWLAQEVVGSSGWLSEVVVKWLAQR